MGGFCLPVELPAVELPAQQACLVRERALSKKRQTNDENNYFMKVDREGFIGQIFKHPRQYRPQWITHVAVKDASNRNPEDLAIVKDPV